MVSLSARAWTVLGLAFLVITLLLTLTAVTLISQRQRTVLLNRQIATLLDETTLVLERAAPALDALPRQSSTVASRARSAAELVGQARSLIAALRAAGLPQTVGAAGQVLQSIDQPGALPHTLGSLDRLATEANESGLVPTLLSRTGTGLDDLAALTRLESRTLQVQEASLENSRRTRALTAAALTTARRTMSVALEILDVARQTLAHAANIDRKTGPAVP